MIGWCFNIGIMCFQPSKAISTLIGCCPIPMHFATATVDLSIHPRSEKEGAKSRAKLVRQLEDCVASAPHTWILWRSHWWTPIQTKQKQHSNYVGCLIRLICRTLLCPSRNATPVRGMRCGTTCQSTWWPSPERAATLSQLSCQKWDPGCET